jgi:GNAT superfamily N-acetyltransferase
MELDWHHGDRAELWPLFRLADDSESQLRAYADLGRVLVAHSQGAIVGHLQLVPTDAPGEVEVTNMAVAPEHQGHGVGRALVERALAACRDEGANRVLVATAAADLGALRFYQRVGFRMHSIERDAFTPATGYPDGLLIDGIPLRDRVWLSWERDDGR